MSHRFNPLYDVVFLVDFQDHVINTIENGAYVTKRAEFLVRSAAILDIPIVTTEQMPDKLGETESALKKALGERKVYEKSIFSSCGAEGVKEALSKLGRKSAVIVGIETHICVSGTAMDLLDAGYQVAVCPDATGARSMERHKLGMERLADAGVTRVHTEAVVYEWLHSSYHPEFRNILNLVKEYA